MGHLGGWKMLPAKPGTCPECAVNHPPHYPHNRDSLAYQYRFFDQHGRWPTWNDAIAHCDEAMRALWTVRLTAKGINMDGPGAEPARA